MHALLLPGKQRGDGHLEKLFRSFCQSSTWQAPDDLVIPVLGVYPREWKDTRQKPANDYLFIFIQKKSAEYSVPARRSANTFQFMSTGRHDSQQRDRMRQAVSTKNTHSVGDFISVGSEARRRTPAVYDIIHPENAPTVLIQHKMTPGLPKPLC